MSVSPALDPAQNTVERARLIHRELLQILALIGVAVVAFLVTERLEGSSRQLRQRDSVEWYRRGDARLQTGDVVGAVDAFRHAAVKDRTNRIYAIALAGALVRSGRSNEARATLIAMRESAPEDAELNLQLARLAAERHDITEALRFYQSALYAPSTLASVDVRRRTRGELIRVLLAHDQFTRAEAELLALSADLPNTAADHVDLGQLFERAHEPRRALEQFEAALRLEPRDQAALAGAGTAAFALADYLLASRYLRSVSDPRGETRDMRDLSELILKRDPLGPRLRSAERERRLDAALSAVRDRLAGCLPRTTASDRDALARTAADVQAFAMSSRGRARVTADTIEDGVDLILAAEQQIVRLCAPATTLDTALITIGHLHAAAAP